MWWCDVMNVLSPLSDYYLLWFCVLTFYCLAVFEAPEGFHRERMGRTLLYSHSWQNRISQATSGRVPLQQTTTPTQLPNNYLTNLCETSASCLEKIKRERERERETERTNAAHNRLTYSQRFLCVFLFHGGPDDIRAMDAILMAKLLGLVEPFSSHVSELAPVTDSLLEVPEYSNIRGKWIWTLISKY